MTGNPNRVVEIYTNTYRIMQYPTRESANPTHISISYPYHDQTDDELACRAWELPVWPAYPHREPETPVRTVWAGDLSDFEARQAADEAWAAEFLADLVKDWS